MLIFDLGIDKFRVVSLRNKKADCIICSEKSQFQIEQFNYKEFIGHC